MGPKSDAEDSDTDSRDIFNRAIPPSEIMSKPISGSPVARLFCKNRFDYLINKTRVLVGRSGGESRIGDPDVDVRIDNCSLYISRRHFDIIVRDYNKFYVSVYSKNGLYVNGLFVKHGSTECQLKDLARLRFPKTDLKIVFQLLERDSQSTYDSGQHQLSSVVCAEGGEAFPDSQYNSQGQSYNSHQQLAMMKDSDRIQDNAPTQVALNQTKLEKEVYKQYHAPQTQQTKKRKFREPEIDAAAHNHEWTSRGDYADGRKPPFSYSQLIAQAIFSAPGHMLCLNDIYMFITKTYPFYKPEDKGWQNSIRHNLSLSKSFVRQPRANDEGKGSLWSIEPADKQNLFKTAYRPRGTRDKYNHAPPPKIPRVVPDPATGESEESNEVTYQNEDEEAANNIAMVNQVPTESFNFVSNEHFGESEDQMVKAPQAAILQSSFANPMQIFMQPDRRGGLNQQHINISQFQRANVGGAGSVQVVRLINPNAAGEMNFGTFDASGQQESLDLAGVEPTQEAQQVWQPQQIRIPQSQVAGTGQRIIILRPATQQQQQQQQHQQQQQIGAEAGISTSVQQGQPKKIILSTSGGGLTLLNAGSTMNKDHGQLQRIVLTPSQFQQTQQIQESLQNYTMDGQGNQIQVQARPQSDENDRQQQQFEAMQSDPQQQQQQALLEQLLHQKQQQDERLLNAGHFEAQPEEEEAKDPEGGGQEERMECESAGDSSVPVTGAREIPIMEYNENS